VTSVRAVTALSQIEDRLRRYLDLVGEVNTQFAPNAIPVVIVGDASEPGNNLVSGRRFAGTVLATSAVASTVAIKFGQDAIIDGMEVWASTAGADISFHVAPADAGADPFAIATLFASWRELNTRTADRAPLFSSAVNAGAGLGNGIWRALVQTQNKRSFDAPMQVVAGTRIFLTTVNAAGIGAAHWNVWGRIL
jgi:hypothetical protein